MIKGYTYKTSNTILATSLISLGFIPQDYQKINNKVFILFENSIKLKKSEFNFWKRKLKIEPIDFHMHLEQTKSKIFETLDNEKTLK